MEFKKKLDREFFLNSILFVYPKTITAKIVFQELNIKVLKQQAVGDIKDKYENKFKV